MLFNAYVKEADEVAAADDIDILAAATVDPDSAEAIEAMANAVEQHMTAAALEAATFFENGEDAVKHFTESAEVQALVEARRLSKRTFVRLGKNDDLQRRKNYACLLLAKEHKDPLWSKLAKNRIMERKLRGAIFAKYGHKADVIARKSQVAHIKAMRKMPSLPKISFN